MIKTLKTNFTKKKYFFDEHNFFLFINLVAAFHENKSLEFIFNCEH